MGEQNHNTPLFQLMESAPDAMYISVQGKFVYLNPSALVLFGVTNAADLRGTDVIERIAPDYHAQARARMHRACDKREPTPLQEERVVRVNGVSVEVDIVAAPFTYNGEKGLIALLRDISVRKRLEAQTRALNRDLERRVTQRTAELQKKRPSCVAHSR